MLRSDLCDYSSTYIIGKERVDLVGSASNENDKVGKDFAFKNNIPFR